MAPITRLTENKSQPSTQIARSGLYDLLGPTNEEPANENHRQSQGLVPCNHLQLVQELPVHRQISLVDGDAKSAENGSDGFAVLEGPADDAEAGVVDYHALVGVWWSRVSDEQEKLLCDRAGLFVCTLLGDFSHGIGQKPRESNDVSSSFQSSPVRIPMDKKLIQVLEQEICIDFTLDSKCRANVRLTSLCTTATIAFKVQTSSLHKFLVKPPIGLISLLSHAQLPLSYPCSPSDGFLIKTIEFLTIESTHSKSINHWFFSSSFPHGSTHDIKLKVAFVGPLLLHHVVTCRDYDNVRNIIKWQRIILAELPLAEAESIFWIATELENLINLLLEVGLRIGRIRASVSCGQVYYKEDFKCVSKKFLVIHVAETYGQLDHVLGLRESSADPTTTIDHSRSRHDFAHNKDMGELVLIAARRGDLKDVELLLKNGADINCRDHTGHNHVARVLIRFRSDLGPLHIAVGGGSLGTSNGSATPQYMATSMGYDDIAEFLNSRKVNLNRIY
ncbi:ankyrin repeat domain-containing protein 50-like [Pyrus ussuriensis x Pyrus communis]|uniref:Ankyrin repeat domain-containing protein 50-like n=1 Tax=Pyrus ussuriensis x Pyrus communis TaxID=2448454 RepID=A0A5N5F0S0_9ROSA|nr:ankyrin repeat domain-containing protein 50-like [Pyrus ussuriensis x Pyrus communis]